MSKAIPKGWSAATLDRYCDVIGGGTPSRGVSEYWGGDIPWASPTEITTRTSKYISSTKENITQLGLEKSSAKLLPPCTVLMTSRASIGYVAINTVPMTTNQGFQSLKCNKDSASADYMYQYITWIRPELEKMSAGSTFSEISSASVKRMHVTLPPLPEQQKIATILSSVDNVIEKTRAQIDKLKDLKIGMMQELLTKGIGHTEFKDSPVGRIPAGWDITKLGAIVLPKGGIQTGPFGSQLHAHEYIDWGVPVIMPRDMKGNKIDPASVAHIPLERAEELDKHRVEIGDLVFARRGDIGRFALVDKTNEGWVCGTGCLKVRMQLSVNPVFIASYLTLRPVIEWLNTNAVGQTMLNLNTSILSELPVILPSEHEQNIIGEAILSLDNKIGLDVKKLDSLINIKKALMQDLLAGKVRVNYKSE